MPTKTKSANTQNNWIDTTKLPDPELGTAPITGDRYHSKEFMEQEWEKMWTKVWLIAGLESQLKKAGDFITCEIGPESILCTKDKSGKIRAFYNVCQHRGNILMHEEQGSEKFLTCKYHGWMFTADGELARVPAPEDYPQGNPCGKLRLTEIPCEVFAGFIWYSMDEKVKPLDEYLGPLKEQLARYKMDQMKRTHWMTVEGEFNWKIVQDNFNESYHLPFVHPQTRYILEQSYLDCQFDMYAPEGHTRMIMPGSRPSRSLKGETDTVMEMLKEEMDFWDLNQDDFRDNPYDIREALINRKREFGEEKGFDYSEFNDAQLVDHFHYTMFPNVSYSLKPDGCIWLRANPHPTNPEKCIFDIWYFTWFPEGTSDYYSRSMYEAINLEEDVPHQVGKVGEVSTGPVIDQDVSIWNTQQKGLKSRGYKGDYLPAQENRVRFFHENVDRYLAAKD